jgi:chitinase
MNDDVAPGGSMKAARSRRALLGISVGLGILTCGLPFARPESPAPFAVVAYFHGNSAEIETYRIDRLTHINYSFLRMNGNKLVVRGVRDSMNITRLVSVKKKNPNVKVGISFAGWGGCETCSDVFAVKEGRKEFAKSAKEILQRFGADGIDLDWEYPAVEGYPGHKYSPADKESFTLLIQELRSAFGKEYEISFAAGGFADCLRNSVDWARVMPLVDRVHVMTYDLVNGYSTVTGHHTPLYSTAEQAESTDRGVRLLDSLGVPAGKIVIGGAFYARVFEDVGNERDGLFQKGRFKTYLLYRDFDRFFENHEGFEHHWDTTAQAPYSYNPRKRLFATYDNQRSVTLKTRYAMRNKLGGIMFWELSGDRREHGLLEAIDQTRKENK